MAVKFNPSTHGELTGDIIASQITKALADGIPVWRAVGNVLDLFFDARWIEVSYNPSSTPVYAQGEVPYGPLTKAWQLDPLTELPVAIWFKSGWGLLEWTQLWAVSSGPAAFPTKYPGPMTPVGADFAGTSGQWADGNHSHPVNPAPPDPVSASSTLYTAKVGDPLLKGSAYSAFRSYSSCVGALFAGWSEIAPGVMQKDDTGPLSSILFDDMDVDAYNPSGVSNLLGKVVFAYDTGLDDYSKTLMGPWIVDDVGGHYENYGTPSMTFVATYARMHRAPDFSYSAAFVHGMMFNIENGTYYGGGHVTLNSTSVDLGTTPMDWSFASGPAPATAEKWEALTGPQLTSEGALSTVLEQSATATSSNTSGVQMDNVFVTLAGTPGVAALAAGPYRFDVEAVRVSGGDPGSSTYLRARFVKHSDGSELLSADSASISNPVDAPLTFIRSLGAPVTISPTEQISWQWIVFTNSTTPVTVTMRYNSAARGTKVTLPFEMPVTGASDGVHNHMSGRDKDVASTDPANSDACHPACAIGAGRFHTPFTEAAYAGGVVTCPADVTTARGSNVATVALTGNLQGIDSTGWSSGDVLELYASGCSVATPRQLVSDASMVPPVLPIRTTVKPGTTTYISPQMTAPMMRLRFRLDTSAHVWWLEGMTG